MFVVTHLQFSWRTYLNILERVWYANFKMVWYVLLRPLRPELDGQDPFQILGFCVKLEKRRLLELNQKHQHLIFY
jgi:hypothetical protein